MGGHGRAGGDRCRRAAPGRDGCPGARPPPRRRVLVFSGGRWLRRPARPGGPGRLPAALPSLRRRALRLDPVRRRVGLRAPPLPAGGGGVARRAGVPAAAGRDPRTTRERRPARRRTRGQLRRDGAALAPGGHRLAGTRRPVPEAGPPRDLALRARSRVSRRHGAGRPGRRVRGAPAQHGAPRRRPGRRRREALVRLGACRLTAEGFEAPGTGEARALHARRAADRRQAARRAARCAERAAQGPRAGRRSTPPAAPLPVLPFPA